MLGSRFDASGDHFRNQGSTPGALAGCLRQKPTAAAMPLPIPLSTKPMEAEPVDELPRGKGRLYEPKYDGSAAGTTTSASGHVGMA